MKVGRLIWLISLAILASLLLIAGLNHATTSANPVLRADGGAPVPPPIPIPWVPTLS